MNLAGTIEDTRNLLDVSDRQQRPNIDASSYGLVHMVELFTYWQIGMHVTRTRGER